MIVFGVSLVIAFVLVAILVDVLSFVEKVFEQAVLVVAVLLTIGLYNWMPSHVVEIRTETPVFSASLTGGAHGVFVLGSGHVGEDAYYYFYKEEDGYLRLEKVRASWVLLDVRDDREPAFIEKRMASQSKLKKVLFWPIPPVLELERADSILVVPTNAVTEQYDVNLLPSTLVY